MRIFDYKKLILNAVWLFIAWGFLYGLSRLYYQSTGGFSIDNIRSNYSYHSDWETRPLKDSEKQLADTVLSQKFFYLGKGCQSYVFGSEDGDYVIKFFKYQRIRPASWLKFFTFIPGVQKYYEKKLKVKKRKREVFFQSWKLAFDHLSDETGTIYVHLNKTNHLNKILTVSDKVGYNHQIWIDDFEFMIQKKAKMLCNEIDDLMCKGSIDQADNVLVTLIDTIVNEYHRGFADNDHASFQL